MNAQWVERFTGSLDDKKRYKQYKARSRALPESYRTAIGALERYVMYSGPIADGAVLVTMLDDLVDLFEQGAADGTPIRDIVGDDPAEFAAAFLQNYSDGQWINKERKRLSDAIDRAAREDQGPRG